MFKIMQSVIHAGNFKLADMRYKVNKLYVQGDLTEEQADQLMALASGGVSPDAERPETLKLIQTLSDKITALEDRVKKLEGGGEDPDVPVDPDAPVEHPEWTPWDGISSDYQPGAIVKHNGKVWISTFAGQNVWEPGVVGVGFWEEYKDGVE